MRFAGCWPCWSQLQQLGSESLWAEQPGIKRVERLLFWCHIWQQGSDTTLLWLTLWSQLLAHAGMSLESL